MLSWCCTVQVLSGMDAKTIHTTDTEPEVVEHCVISHGSSLLAWANHSGVIRLMSFNSKSIRTIGQHSQRITVLKFSPSDGLLLTACRAGTVKVLPARFNNHFTLYFPQSNLIWK